MSSHPYKNLPDWAYWRKSVGQIAPRAFDPITQPQLRILKTDKVATAGSCFAQHISRSLRKSGFNFLVTERPNPVFGSHTTEAENYGVYTARYGNIYTARQLLQLFQRAYGLLSPEEGAWERRDGRYVDPFRPEITPDGFGSIRELEADREFHLSCVREAFETLDVMTFTMGLTEAWGNKSDGVVYPICPGVIAGLFDPTIHEFNNFSASQVTADMDEFITLLSSVNKKARLILTVSPVPLVATASESHVLVATTYSKSVLRVAAQEIAEKFAQVVYFPSYEIITGNYNRGSYFENDLRSVTPDGVQHVMSIFARHFVEGGETLSELQSIPDKDDESAQPALDQQVIEQIERVRLVCEEEALDSGL